MEARNDRTGEVIFKDNLESAVAGIVQVLCEGCACMCVRAHVYDACVHVCVHTAYVHDVCGIDACMCVRNLQ